MEPVPTGRKDTRSTNGKSSPLRNLPSVDRVLAHAALSNLRAILPHALLVDATRDELGAIRAAVLRDDGAVPPVDAIAGNVAERVADMLTPSIRPVINATGVIIHTNLGRAPLSQAAVEAVKAAASYSNLEYDLSQGVRGSRYSHAVDILRRVTGAEDALVVNNNAAALVLTLAAFAAGQEVILSRGMSVEIGGGFRIPEIMQTGGATLREVGTTNRTYVRDYANAISTDTAILMRVHASNFRIEGFTASPELEELATLAQVHRLLLVDDLGSGALLDTGRFGLAPEPMVQTSLQQGVDLVLFSGDKLLGGPQSGIILGKSALIGTLKGHPLTRALRVDKITLAALEATLLHYLKGEAEQQVPVWRMISAQEQALKRIASRWARTLRQKGLLCKVRPGRSAVGGGSLPGETLPTWLVSISPGTIGMADSEALAGCLADSLRGASVPVIARVEKGELLLDPRTVLPGQEATLLAEVAEAATLTK